MVDSMLKPFFLGVTAGMRSQMPLALLALAARQGRVNVGRGRPWSLLRSPKMGGILCLSAAGEMIGDKLPATPSRLEPGPLGGRLVFGAVAGAAVSPGSRGSRLGGALLGLAGAAAGAYGGYHARSILGQRTDVPDPFWGMVEDGAAIGIGSLAVRR